MKNCCHSGLSRPNSAMYCSWTCCSCSPPVPPPMASRPTMASTGLPGMRRGRRKFSSRATTKTTRVHATFRPIYLASAMVAAFAPLRQMRFSSGSNLLDLEQPLDARAVPHRGSVRVLLGREVLPVARIELVELQWPVHQRHYRH